MRLITVLCFIMALLFYQCHWTWGDGVWTWTSWMLTGFITGYVDNDDLPSLPHR